MEFKNKYLKYKFKYMQLKKQFGGYDKNNFELIEIFYNDKSKINNKILSTTKDTKNLLKKYNLLQKNYINLVFDLHNVLDLLPQDYKINRKPNTKIICCSYVGRKSNLREKATSEIIKRIKTKQIDWGVLVFKRGKKHKNEDPFTYHNPGSKAWFCNLVKASYFYDDSIDHIKSVKSLFDKNNLTIKTIQIENKEELIKLIK